MESDAMAYQLGPVEGSPWLRLSLLGDGLELTCEVCRYAGSASAKALEKDPGVIERAAAWHERCGVQSVKEETAKALEAWGLGEGGK